MSVLLAGLCLTALILRAWPVHELVFPAGAEPRLLGIDAYYHLRHTTFSAAHFPNVQRWEVATHYPLGLRSPATGLFNVTLAGAARLHALVTASPDSVLRVSAWAPAILGVLTLLAVYRLTRAFASRGWALLAAAFFVAYPGGALARTLLGYADHHAAEMLLGVLAIDGLTRCLRDAPALGARGRLPRWRSAVLGALPLAALFYTWKGGAIFLLLVAAAVLAVISVEIAQGADTRPSDAAMRRYGTALTAMLALPGLLAPDALLVPRVFPLAIAACAVLTLGPTLHLAAARAITARTGARGAVALCGLLAAAVLLGVAVFVSDSIARHLAALLAPKTLFVSEHRVVDAELFWTSLGGVGLLALLAPALLPRGVWSEPARLARLPVSVVGILVILLWWRTHDYDYQVPAYCAVLATIALMELTELARRRGALALPGGVLAAAALLLLAPVFGTAGVQPLVRDASAYRVLLSINTGWQEAMRWLENATPRPTLAIDAPTRPFSAGGFDYPEGTYGVLSAWEFGNFVSGLGGRPVVYSASPSAKTVRFFAARSEAESLARLCPDCEGSEGVRYVVVDARTVGELLMTKLRTIGLEPRDFLERDRGFQLPGELIPRLVPNDAYRELMVVRLFMEDGAGLGRYRLVYESPHRSYLAHRVDSSGFQRVVRTLDSEADMRRFGGRDSPEKPLLTRQGIYYEERVRASVKIFERVEGARIEGRAPPGGLVEAQLPLLAPSSGRRFDYTTSTRADEAGRYQLRLPYATDAESPHAGTQHVVATRDAYALRASAAADAPDASAVTRSLEVREADVQRGARIEVELLR